MFGILFVVVHTTSTIIIGVYNNRWILYIRPHSENLHFYNKQYLIKTIEGILTINGFYCKVTIL
jgi:hypothetical protein